MPRKELLRALARVDLDVLATIEARDRNSVAAPPPSSELLLAPEPTEEAGNAHTQTGTRGATLTDILSAFHAERTAGSRSLAQKTMNEHKVAVRMFEEFMGGQ